MTVIDVRPQSVEWSLKLVDVEGDELSPDCQPLKEEFDLWLRNPINWIHELIITQEVSIKFYHQIAMLSPTLHLLLLAADTTGCSLTSTSTLLPDVLVPIHDKPSSCILWYVWSRVVHMAASTEGFMCLPGQLERARRPKFRVASTV